MFEVFSKRWSFFKGHTFNYSYSIKSKNPVAKALGKLGALAFFIFTGWVLVSVLSSSGSAENLWKLTYILIGFIALLAWGIASIKFADRYFPSKGDTPYQEDHYYG